jgi:hypothetical protein
MFSEKWCQKQQHQDAYPMDVNPRCHTQALLLALLVLALWLTPVQMKFPSQVVMCLALEKKVNASPSQQD